MKIRIPGLQLSMGAEDSSDRPAPLREGATLTSRHVETLSRAIAGLGHTPGLADCSGPVCICVGDEDCNDMFDKGCGDAICFETAGGGVVCLCMKT